MNHFDFKRCSGDWRERKSGQSRSDGGADNYPRPSRGQAARIGPLDKQCPSSDNHSFDCRTPESPTDGSSLAWPGPRCGLRRRERERSSSGPPSGQSDQGACLESRNPVLGLALPFSLPPPPSNPLNYAAVDQLSACPPIPYRVKWHSPPEDQSLAVVNQLGQVPLVYTSQLNEILTDFSLKICLKIFSEDLVQKDAVKNHLRKLATSEETIRAVRNSYFVAFSG